MSLNLKDPTTREEVEALLTAKIESGEAEPGLYETGLPYVVASLVNGKVEFQWFSSTILISDLID